MNRFPAFLVALAICLHCAAQTTQTSDPISPSDPRIQIIGRVDPQDPARIRIAYPGVMIRFRFSGTLAEVLLTSDADDTYVVTVMEAAKRSLLACQRAQIKSSSPLPTSVPARTPSRS